MLTWHEKELSLRMHKLCGKSLKDVAEHHRVDISTVHNWERRLETGIRKGSTADDLRRAGKYDEYQRLRFDQNMSKEEALKEITNGL